MHLLSAQPELTEVALPRAVRLAADPPEGERLDPATASVAGLVLVVLQTEIDWTRSSTGGGGCGSTNARCETAPWPP